ncbi:Signal-transduction histidine kinase senX3 [Propionibacterium australiense]|uniref:Sensor-like histidine kinase SenX3 n=1 Tax=Propionibacterium australiense TaxID=119981 RepID=A0A383S6H7_9ACTN|nr:two-component sensor histidine kinase [Propionibacterium australiense]RLP11380.1 two-component sensor histidine kinase [Propionibacterium australiense]SYZ33024.1 histidine kinase [Propionibacterium australiense]VEH92221.1 Signal-transduction histidine kinase senX3 [Propionibacterium australiense]
MLLSFLLGAAVGAALALVLAWGRRARARIAEQTPVISPEVPAVLDAFRQPVVIIGPHDEIRYANAPSRAIGLVRGTRVGIGEVLGAARTARRTGEGSDREVSLGSSDGGPSRQLHVRIRPLDREAVLLVGDDRSALIRVDESKRDLVSNISHELKTPVGALQVLAETIQEAADDPDYVRHFASRMAAESTRLGELVQQIIELGRLQSDDPLGDAAPVDVDEVVAAAASRASASCQARDIHFSIAGDKGLRVIGDRHQLRVALSNLVENAISYSDHGARVAVTVKAVDEDGDHWVDIAVTDNGIGISTEDQKRIFERFYRVDYARSRENGGTGLGLSIVKHVVIAHGGTVRLWSRPGRGSTFTMRLPALIGRDDATQLEERS